MSVMPMWVKDVRVTLTTLPSLRPAKNDNVLYKAPNLGDVCDIRGKAAHILSWARDGSCFFRLLTFRARDPRNPLDVMTTKNVPVSAEKFLYGLLAHRCHYFSSVNPSVTSILAEISDITKFHIFGKSSFKNTYILNTLLMAIDISQYKFKIQECENFPNL